LFANEFNNRGIAFFTYNRRGVTIGNTPPYYDSVDMEKYRKYLPSVETEDIAAIISGLKLDKRLLNAKVVLLGWSEGTILAAMVADKKKSAVDALLLAGYANDNIFDIIRWQNSGEPSILNIKKYFDADHNGVISRQEYESTEKAPTSLRTGSFRNARFEQIDVDKDSVVSSGDFKIINGPRLKAIMDAYDRKDGDWIWKNYFRVTIEWLTEHQSLEANRTRLPRLEIPIYIFHGEDDANASVKGVYGIRDIFAEKQKSNLQCFVFKGHNHDLNFLDFPVKKTIPEGIQKIFEVAEELNK
jgi:pimeloyl-ACP methyl ester carboxylesterase